MILVVDASVVVKWFVAEDGAATARGLLAAGHDFVAPEHLVAEALNVTWKKRRLGQIDEETEDDLLRYFGSALLDLHPLRPLAPRAAAIARQLDHPVYDCFYLALAEARDAPLVTADRRLAGRVAGTPFAARVRHLADVADLIGEA